MSLKELAKHYKISCEIIKLVIKEQGISIYDAQIETEQIRNEIIKLWESGKSRREILDITGYSKSTINKYIRQHESEFVSNKQYHTISNMLKQRIPINKIHSMTGIKKSSILKIKTQEKINYKQVHKSEINEIIKLHESGKSTIQISKITKIPKESVSDILKSSGKTLHGRLSEEDKNNIIKLAELGMKTNLIDKKLNRNEGCSYSYLKRIGRTDLLLRLSNQYTSEIAEEIIHLRKTGWKFSQLEEKYKVSDTTIRNWIKRYETEKI